MKYNPLETEESRKDFAEKLERHFKAVGNEIPIEWITLALDTEAGLAQLKERYEDEQNELERLREENERLRAEKDFREWHAAYMRDSARLSATLAMYHSSYSRPRPWQLPYPWEH